MEYRCGEIKRLQSEVQVKENVERFGVWEFNPLPRYVT
jgi:hypothetical protein